MTEIQSSLGLGSSKEDHDHAVAWPAERPMKPTSQQLGDIALAEHRAVMAALLKECISRPTEDQYEAVLDALREEFSKCPVTTRPYSL